jgi:hypothetical protein
MFDERSTARVCILECRVDAPKRCQMSSVQLPVTVLTVLGILIVVLGLFAAGSLAMAVVGLVAVAFAGVLAVIGTRRA